MTVLAIRSVRRSGNFTTSGGFTIIELLASVAIIGVLAAVATPVMQTTIKRQKEAQLQIALRDIRNAIDAYKQATVNGNIVLQQGQSPYPSNLAILVSGVPNALQNDQPMYFLRSVPPDPFYPDQTVPTASMWGLRSYETAPSNAPLSNSAAVDDVFDVGSISSQIGLNGIPYYQW